MDDLGLLVHLHRDAQRQGPGGDAETGRAIELSGLSDHRALTIADIGCGTGASTMVLAQALDARIWAIDLLPEFLVELDLRATRAGLSESIKAVAASMDALPLVDGSLDAIWSEGAIYQIGFAKGVREWRRYLKPGGVLAVSELTWLTDERPRELESYWVEQYSEVATASAKMAALEDSGYSPVGYFVLPEQCWLDAYYRPMRRRFPAFLQAQGSSAAAKALVAAEEGEIALYERHRAFVGYGFYIARKTNDGN